MFSFPNTGKRYYMRKSGMMSEKLSVHYANTRMLIYWYKSANKQWHEWLDSIFKRTDDIFDVTIEFDTGLGAKGTINSVTVG